MLVSIWALLALQLTLEVSSRRPLAELLALSLVLAAQQLRSSMELTLSAFFPTRLMLAVDSTTVLEVQKLLKISAALLWRLSRSRHCSHLVLQSLQALTRELVRLVVLEDLL